MKINTIKPSTSIKLLMVLLLLFSVLLLILAIAIDNAFIVKANASPTVELRQTTIVDFPSNIGHLDNLVAVDDGSAPFYPSRALTHTGLLTNDMFDSPEVCAGCHSEIYTQWKDSVMALAWEDPIYRALLAKASKATKGAVDNFCIGCHSPIGLTTGNAVAVGEDKALSPGVDCDSCHNMSDSTGNGNASYILTPNKFGYPLKFGPRKDAVSPIHDTAYSELHTKSGFCATCHNVTHPFNKLAIERTYDEWRDSPYNGEGITCQDCHMTPGPGVSKNPGKSAIMGLEREHVYSHGFVGANVTLHRYFGQEDLAQQAVRMLQSAAKLEFVNPPVVAHKGSNITVKVKVTNSGAGHKLPTGFPEGREIWVDFKVLDVQGKEVYRLGAIKNGYTEYGTKNFKAVLGDKDGNVIEYEVWKAARILSDNRILPKGFAMLDYYVYLPLDIQGPLHITADLNYWSFPQSTLDKIVDDNKIKVEVIKMTSIDYMLDVKSSKES